MRWLWLAGLVFALEAAPYHIVREWQAGLGVAQRGITYRAAICPDGTFWMTNGLGDAAALSASGRLLPTRRGLAGFRDVMALACGPAGLLYAANREGLFVYLDAALLRQARPAIAISAMAVAGDGSIYAIGWMRGRSLSRPLHVLTPDGSVRISFGEPPSRFVLPVRPKTGFALWDEARRQFLFIPQFQYDIQVYNPEGRLLKVSGPGSQQPLYPARLGIRVADELLGAARLPDGTVVVEARGSTGRPGDPVTYLDLYDAGLREVQTALPTIDGTLIGASSDGAVYFLLASPRGMAVTRARLR